MDYKVDIQVNVKAEHVPQLLTLMGQITQAVEDASDDVSVIDVKYGKNSLTNPGYTHRGGFVGGTDFGTIITNAAREAQKRGFGTSH